MRPGLSDPVAATTGEATDAAGPACVCPSGRAFRAGEGYCGREAIDALEADGCHDARIERDNLKDEDRDNDKRISGMRDPYERAFSKTPNPMRCPGPDKARFQVGASAMDCNRKGRLQIPQVPTPAPRPAGEAERGQVG